MSSRTAVSVLTTIVVVTVLTAVVSVEGEAQVFYQFEPGQTIGYDVTLVEDGVAAEGHYRVVVEAAGSGQLRVTVDAQVGDNSCRNSSTVAAGAGAAGQIMMACIPLMPVGAALFAPTWTMFFGHSWDVGSSWTMGDVSFQVTEACSYAGKSGVRMIMQEEGETKIETCSSRTLPLPLYVKFRTDDEDYVELEVTELEGV